MADVQPLQIANWLHLKEDSVWRTWIKDYGVFAAAFVIMKLLFPMRLALEIVLTRLIHGTVNRNVQPVWDRVCGFCGWTGEEGDDEGGEGSGEGREMLGLHSYKEVVEDEDHVLLAGEASEDVETLVATERNSWNSHVGRASSPTSRFRHSSQE
ncbi:hypothetical protein HDU79_011624 [Rhizoclosmatium sp. JEL0117]|nr:hypothetical protein HDU79_011624 [Rhizoclosmatium sp. JEL0117]